MSHIPFERWKPQEPPSDFLARVDQALDAQATAAPPPLLRRRALLVGLSAAAAGASIWGNYTLTRRILRGTLNAQARTELEVAQGVTAIAEPGARLSYNDGLVQQHEGEVTYRTAPQANLRLTTPAGAAEGQGACCRVRVLPTADPDLETSGPATVLAVFQGSLDLHHAGRTERLTPNQYALSSGNSIRTNRDDRSGAIARALSLPVPAAPSASVASAPVAPEPPPSAAVASAPPPRPLRSAPPPSASAPVAPPPASASAAPSARPFIVPRCICIPGDAFCACPER